MNQLRDHTLTIEALRNEQTALISGSGKLLGYGITSHVADVINRLNAIKSEARQIADALDALGATDLAEQARQGWAIIVAPTIHDGRSG